MYQKNAVPVNRGSMPAGSIPKSDANDASARGYSVGHPIQQTSQMLHGYQPFSTGSSQFLRRPLQVVQVSNNDVGLLHHPHAPQNPHIMNQPAALSQGAWRSSQMYHQPIEPSQRYYEPHPGAEMLHRHQDGAMAGAGPRPQPPRQTDYYVDICQGYTQGQPFHDMEMGMGEAFYPNDEFQLPEAYALRRALPVGAPAGASASPGIQQRMSMYPQPYSGVQQPPPLLPDQNNPYKSIEVSHGLHERVQYPEFVCTPGPSPERHAPRAPPPPAPSAPRPALTPRASAPRTVPTKVQPAAHPAVRVATPAPQPASSTRPLPLVDIGLRVLTGTVDQILLWGRKVDEAVRPNVIFEIVGSLDGVRRGPLTSSYLISLRALEGSATVQGVFWEIDRALLAPDPGSIVSCMCRLGPKPSAPAPRPQLPRLQVLKMHVVPAVHVNHLKRISYVCSHAVQQGALQQSEGEEQSHAKQDSKKQTLISSFASRNK